MSVLPTWRGPRDGSGCDNEDCPATGRWVTVASRREIDLIFPRKDRLSFWPLPDQATHVCTVCGFVYQGVSEDTTFDQMDNGSAIVDASEFDWDPATAYDAPVREAAEAFIEGAPEGISVSQLADGISQHIPGVDHRFARELLAEHENIDADVDTDTTNDS